MSHLIRFILIDCEILGLLINQPVAAEHDTSSRALQMLGLNPKLGFAEADVECSQFEIHPFVKPLQTRQTRASEAP